MYVYEKEKDYLTTYPPNANLQPIIYSYNNHSYKRRKSRVKIGPLSLAIEHRLCLHIVGVYRAIGGQDISR